LPWWQLSWRSLFCHGWQIQQPIHLEVFRALLSAVHPDVTNPIPLILILMALLNGSSSMLAEAIFCSAVSGK